MNDKEIYEKIKKGDTSSFEMLYKKYHPKMYSYCKGLLKDPDLAKDVVQEAFIIFWENRENIMIEAAISSYLFHITHNQCLKQIRRNAVKNNFSDLSNVRLLEIEASYFSPGKNVLGGLYFEELEKQYKKVLEKLPKQCQVIFEMSKDQEMSNSEIANVLNLSTKTVENQLYRGLKEMKKSLMKYTICDIT